MISRYLINGLDRRGYIFLVILAAFAAAMPILAASGASISATPC